MTSNGDTVQGQCIKCGAPGTVIQLVEAVDGDGSVKSLNMLLCEGHAEEFQRLADQWEALDG